MARVPKENEKPRQLQPAIEGTHIRPANAPGEGYWERLVARMRVQRDQLGMWWMSGPIPPGSYPFQPTNSPLVNHYLERAAKLAPYLGLGNLDQISKDPVAEARKRVSRAHNKG